MRSYTTGDHLVVRNKVKITTIRKPFETNNLSCIIVATFQTSLCWVETPPTEACTVPQVTPACEILHGSFKYNM